MDYILASMDDDCAKVSQWLGLLSHWTLWQVAIILSTRKYAYRLSECQLCTCVTLVTLSASCLQHHAADYYAFYRWLALDPTAGWLSSCLCCWLA